LLKRTAIGSSTLVVDAQGHQEVVALRVLEAQRAGSAAAAHGQRVLAIALAPGASVGEVPVGLLHDAEPVGGVGLDDPDVDRVRHGDGR
jgi:hypothetical protein